MYSNPFTQMDLQKCLGCIDNSFLVITFEQDSDFAIIFGVTLEHHQVNGISIYFTRKSKGYKPTKIKEDIIQELFTPSFSKIEDNKWILKLNSIQEHITITKKSHGFVSLYPFRKQSKIGKIKYVHVQSNLSKTSVFIGNTPLKMSFTITAEFRKDANTPPETIHEQIECSKSFTDAFRSQMRS